MFINICIIILAISTVGCTKNENEHIQYDSQKKSFSIGEQTWSSKNASIKYFANGDSIPYAQSTKDWEMAGELKIPAWCYAEGDSSEILYNWYAISDHRGFAPKGWHLPAYEEIEYLMKVLHIMNELENRDNDPESAYATYHKRYGKEEIDTNFRYSIPLQYNGNRFGNGRFKGKGEIGVFWTSEKPEKTNYIPVYAQLAKKEQLYMVSSNPANGAAVRLLKDE